MEGTTTLADALLDDLDDLMDSDDDDQNDDSQNAEASVQDGDIGHHNGDILSESSMQKSSVPESSPTTESEANAFLQNPSLVKHMKIIRQHNESCHTAENGDEKPPSTVRSSNQKEKEEENHQLVVQSNKHLASLEEELERAHGELANAYNPKFPELEELLPNPLHYKNAVRIIGNETDLTKVNDELNEILTSNQIITISMAGSTTSGRVLTEDELRMVDVSASYMENLLEVQKDLMKFVENSMESLCPSICALIGAPTAARLLGLAGGLQDLTKVSRHGE